MQHREEERREAFDDSFWMTLYVLVAALALVAAFAFIMLKPT